MIGNDIRNEELNARLACGYRCVFASGSFYLKEQGDIHSCIPTDVCIHVYKYFCMHPSASRLNHACLYTDVSNFKPLAQGSFQDRLLACLLSLTATVGKLTIPIPIHLFNCSIPVPCIAVPKLLAHTLSKNNFVNSQCLRAVSLPLLS